MNRAFSFGIGWAGKESTGMAKAGLGRIFDYAVSDGTPAASLRIAAVVGTVLNIINQGDALLMHGPVSWRKIALTYIVPYCVSTYAVVAARLRQERSERGETE